MGDIRVSPAALDVGTQESLPGLYSIICHKMAHVDIEITISPYV